MDHINLNKGTFQMDNKNILILFITGALSFSPLAKDSKDNAVTLTMDYSGKQQCGYAVDYTSQGISSRKASFPLSQLMFIA